MLHPFPSNKTTTKIPTNQTNKQTHALESSTSLIGPSRQYKETALPAELSIRLYEESCELKKRRNESAGYYCTAVVVNLLCCLKNTSVPDVQPLSLGFSPFSIVCLFVCFFMRCRDESTRSTRWVIERSFSGRSRLHPPPHPLPAETLPEIHESLVQSF